jgi:predicted SAM-dependent methyltransferase
MIKIQFCCGGNKLPGWINHDVDVDIRKPLPYCSTVDFIFVEHGLEHITHQEAWNFLEECHRILKPGGVVRIAIPDVNRIWLDCTPEYQQAVLKSGYGDGSRKSAVKAAVFCHGHQAAWTGEMLKAFMAAVGFVCASWFPGYSPHPELRGIEQHGKTVGDAINQVETSVVEGMKPLTNRH